ncbi:LysR family transcriptional regulator [Moellerella wisconsensis]|uniref:LysR family transcriptional regulator n=1 Tax=Moellerella wisconsensis TaxID=158849 RepID=UPI00307668DD
MIWDDIRVFLAIYRTGAIRDAAQRLTMDQTTVTRRLNNLEKTLDCKLFLRTQDGYILTPAGINALDSAERMERDAVSFKRLSEGVNSELCGDVVLATTDTLAVDFILPALKILREKYPNIRVSVKTSTRILDLSRREADIAVRTLRPEQGDLIVRRLTEWEVGLYATQEYLDKYGMPVVGIHFAGHEVAIYQKGITSRQGATLVGESRKEAKIAAELDSSFMLSTFICSGLALGELPDYQATLYPELIRLWPEKKRKKNYEVWLVMHTDSAQTARVRAVVNVIAEVFEQK